MKLCNVNQFKFFLLVLHLTETMSSLLNPLPIQPTMRTKPPKIKYTKKTTPFKSTTTTTTTTVPPTIQDFPMTDTTPFPTTIVESTTKWTTRPTTTMRTKPTTTTTRSTPTTTTTSTSTPTTTTTRMTTTTKLTTPRTTTIEYTTLRTNPTSTEEIQTTTMRIKTQKPSTLFETTMTAMISNDIGKGQMRTSTSKMKSSSESDENKSFNYNKPGIDSNRIRSTTTELTNDYKTEDLDCVKLMNRIAKKIFKTISLCNKELIAKYPCKDERGEKLLCVTKCLMKKLEMLDKQDYVTVESYRKFMINSVPKPMVEFGMVYAEPCIEEFGPKIDPNSETCSTYAHFMKCIQDSMGELADMCER